ncbi:glycosyltransferase family 2 protein [Patescibacteria group bacterium]|nr:glycosyltransferase family 2 protein [Patescibacteria group bacterium]
MPSHTAGKLKSVSFFCPAYHDEQNLPTLIPRVAEFLKEITDTFEIIIVEDGSPDRTGTVADELAKTVPHVRVIHHPKNLGYGATLHDGFKAARYDYVMYTDGDNQYDIREFKPALPLLNDHDILSGYVTEKAVTNGRKVQSAIYNFFIRALFGLRLRDVNCSMKIYKRKVIDPMQIKSASAFIDAEMLIRASRAGFSIAQFPVTHFHRSSGVASGSKWNVIVDTFVDMIKFRMNIL